jgi:hypothetical protein
MSRIWLELFGLHAEAGCELFGIDADEGSIDRDVGLAHENKTPALMYKHRYKS